MCRIAVCQPLAFGACDFYWSEVLIVFLDPAVGRARRWLLIVSYVPSVVQPEPDGWSRQVMAD